MISNLVFVLRRRWPILVAIPLLSLVLVVFLSPPPAKVAPKFSSAVFLAADPTKVTSVDLSQAAIDIRQTEVAGKAAQSLGLKGIDPARFSQKVKTKVSGDSLTIGLTATAGTAKQAKDFARAFADAFIEVDDARRFTDYTTQLDDLGKDRDRAKQQLTDFLAANAVGLAKDPPDAALVLQQQVLEDRVSAAEQRITALADDQVTSPYRIAGTTPAEAVAASKLELPQSRSVRGVVTLFVAMIGAVLLVALIERFNPRIDTPKDAEDIIGAPVLGMVPIMRGKRKKIVERADLNHFSGPFAESFRAMRAHLDFRSAADSLERPPCVMVVSSAPGEGKTTTAAFLGLSYQEVGRDAVVVGGDFRRPAIHRLFGVARAPGLSSRLLANQQPVRTEDMVRSIVKRDELTGVRVIPSGPGTDRVTGLLGDLSAVTSAGLESGCTVIIDTAPVMVANDAIDFLPFVDWVIVVVRLGKTTVRSLRQSMASLELNDARVAGCAMMGSLESSDAKRYYYSYYRVDEDPDMAPFSPPRSMSNVDPNGPLGGAAPAAAAEPAAADPAEPAGGDEPTA